MRRTAIKGLSFLGLGLIVSACIFPGSECRNDTKNVLPYYHVNNIYTSSGAVYNEFDDYREVNQNDTVYENERFQLNIVSDVDFHAALEKQEVDPKSFWNILPAAYACSPPEYGHKGTHQLLDSLVITSQIAFSDDLPAGTNLRDYFKFSSYYGSKVTYEGYLEINENMAPEYLQMELNQRPNKSGKHAFQVKYYLSSGEEYSTELFPIYFK